MPACENCGAQFVSKASAAKYCQHSCYVEKSRQEAAESLVARFWAKVHKTETCWFWTGNRVGKMGHGQYAQPRGADGKVRPVYAHRFAWTITHGDIPDNLCVLHKCDVPVCVRPDHLFLGTQPDNLADARAKGRLRDGAHRIKVSDADMADICRRYVPRHNGKQLAAEYGITLVHLLRIINGTARVKRVPVPVLEPVRFVLLPVQGDLHLGPQSHASAVSASMQSGGDRFRFEVRPV
jgi:hypothetical protein